MYKGKNKEHMLSWRGTVVYSHKLNRDIRQQDGLYKQTPTMHHAHWDSFAHWS